MHADDYAQVWDHFSPYVEASFFPKKCTEGLYCQHFECTKSDWQEVKKRAPERDLNFFNPTQIDR